MKRVSPVLLSRFARRPLGDHRIFSDAEVTVKDRGTLNCGSNPGLAGFGLADAQGNWVGLDYRLLPRDGCGDLQ